MKKPLLRMNFIDKAIAPFSPGIALRRAKERTALNFMAGSVSRQAAGSKGTLGNWFVRRLTRFTEGYERLKTNDRAEDLIANNSHATSIVDSTTLNVVGGAGLTPQSRPNYKLLGITEEQAQEIADQAEYWFGVWSKQADAEGSDHFSDLQFVTIRSMIGKGEYLNLPCSLETGINRDFNLAIQVLDPRRLRTPYNMIGNRDIRDGIRLGDHCEKLSYFVAEPDDGKLTTFLSNREFKEIPAWRGHRPGIFHGFIRKDAEQVRGISALAPCMKLFRDYDDYMDFEVVGAILAASFPVFIATPEGDDPEDHIGDTVTQEGDKPVRYKEYTPGQVMYGAPGQEPKILKSDRPGNSFQVFVETLLRSVGAATGLPYEIVAKDFSKTNYSSARAALLEAYRVFSMYQIWLEKHFCQPVWEMVFEEAWLRGRIKLPKGAPDFYQARAAYCNAKWIPPKRGAIDPVKEVAAGKEEIISNMGTLADWFAEQGEDWQEQLRQIARERKMMADLGLTMSDLPGFDLKNLASQPEK